MAYTALEKMRKKNLELYGVDIGPKQPSLHETENRNDLVSSALRFLHESCEELRFDNDIEAEEESSGEYRGTSIKPNQIPFNMQMDINRLCFERCMENFMRSGAATDAYLVYYIFWDIFFGDFSKSKKMIELLSEFESNGSSLLMKHRDHYSHSVYVFSLGLAIYETNEKYRSSFKTYCEKIDGKKYTDTQLANLFLEYWGMTSLFHDIGYPFELPFEQVMAYFEVDKKKRGRGIPFIAYHGMENLTDMSEEETLHFSSLYGREFKSVNDLFAYGITSRLGEAYDFSEEYIREVISSKPASPDKYGYFMDHAVFSSIRLYRELADSVGITRMNKYHIDVLTAIILHNSMYKFSVSFYKDEKKKKSPLKADLHPLAWLLMLCDELQCWDRTAYGRNSRTELHPMDADFDFSDNSISAVYYYDKNEQGKIDGFNSAYQKWEESGKVGETPKLKAYSDMAGKEQQFKSNIEQIIDTSICPISIKPLTKLIDRKNKQIYLSDSSFLHLYDFAVSLHGRNKGPEVSVDELEKQFEALSLEYRLSTINRAKNFGRYLDAIGCFYTDRPVDYEMITEFTEEHAAIFAPMEHERWVREHLAMGWSYGSLYEEAETSAEAKNRREQMRCHKLAMDGDISNEDIYNHYLTLSEEDKGKDWKPFNAMLNLLKRFDGIRIYSLK